MPRVNIGQPSLAEKRRQEVGYRVTDFMNRQNIDNHKMAKLLGVSVKTFINKKLHHPEDFTMEEIWIMENTFGCKISEPLCAKACN